MGFLSTLFSGVLQTSAFPALHSQVPVKISLLNHHKRAERDGVILDMNYQYQIPSDVKRQSISLLHYFASNKYSNSIIQTFY